MFHVWCHLCFDGLKASRTFTIRLNLEIPWFTLHAHHLCFDWCKVSRVVFYQNLVQNNSLAKGWNYFCDFSWSMQPGIGKCLQNRILLVNKLPWESSCLLWDHEIDVKSVRLMANPEIWQVCTRIPACDSHSPTLLDLFLSSDASICSKMAFPLLGNSDHVVSVSVHFPSNS